MSAPFLIAMLGYPGSGKTYFSEHHAKRLGAFHLNSDKTRRALFPEPAYTPEEGAIVFRTMDWLAGELLRVGLSVIYDANSNKAVHRERLRKIADDAGAGYRLVWVKTDYDVARDRVARRAELPAEAQRLHPSFDLIIWEAMRAELEEPTNEAGLVIVNGNIPLEEQEIALV